MLQERILNENQPLIIAEVGQNHDGSLGMCHAFIDALADAGADAIKFQTHIAAEESTINEAFRVKFSYQDATRYDYWKRMEFTESQWRELKSHADDKGMGFLCTPFSVAAVELLSRISVEAWKVGSGDTMFSEMLDAMLSTGKPVIISSGMSTWQELDSIVQCLNRRSSAYALLQCTSKYPTPLTEVGLNNLEEMTMRYGCRVGLSDHSGSVSPSMAALARGFTIIEVHATFDRRMFGPDVAASLTIEEIASLAQFARDLRIMDGSPVDKDKMATELAHQKTLFSKSLAPRTDLAAGHVLREEDLALKKPGSGIPWSERQHVIGRKLRRTVSMDQLLKTEDFE